MPSGLPRMVPSADRSTVYDPGTGITWLADADLARSKALGGQGMTFDVPGINPDGSMTWETAMDWIAAMNRACYLGHSDWTLPVDPPGATASLQNKKTGDYYGFDSTSDMGNLYYADFVAQDGESIASVHNANTELFTNFQPYYYWSSTKQGKPKLPVDLSFNNGFLGTDKTIDFEYAIPEYPAEPNGPPLLKGPPNNIIDTTPPGAQPSLVPSQDGKLVYDPNLKVYWLADANLAANRGIDQRFNIPVVTDSDGRGLGVNNDGSMNYTTAVAFINAMNAADYLGHDNWRLPDSVSTTQDYDETYTEMGELFYTQLGGQAGSTIQLTHDSDLRLFKNLQPYYYWSGSEVQVLTGPKHDKLKLKPNTHETFSFGSGYRSGNVDPNEMYVLPVFDAPQVVMNNRDDGSPGSLRAVIGAAHPDDTIVFDPSLAGQTVTPQSPIDITIPLDIEGPGAGKLSVSGNGASGVFNIQTTAMGANGTGVTIAGLTLQGGNGGDSEDSFGGGIYDGLRGALDLLQCDITANKAQGGLGGFGARRGQDGRGFGGGLSIDPDAIAQATSDTYIHNNRADIGPDVYGNLGAI